MFIVPITLFSWALRGVVVVESTTRRVSTTVSISAASTTRRSSACWAPTFTYSVRSSSTWGSSLSTPMIASTSVEALERLGEPAAPVGRQAGDEHALRVHQPEPDRPARAQHVPEILLDPRPHLVGHGLHQRLVLVQAGLVEADRLEEAQLELGGQVAEHPQQPEVREGGRDREVEEAGQPLHAARPARTSARPPRRRPRRPARSAPARASPPRRSRRGRSAAAGSGPCRASRCPCGPRGTRARAAPRRTAAGARWPGGRPRSRSSGSASRSRDSP